jgi:hypothetical protein
MEHGVAALHPPDAGSRSYGMPPADPVCTGCACAVTASTDNAVEISKDFRMITSACG